MRWNYKWDVIALLFGFFGLTIIALLAGIIIPAIVNATHGDISELLKIAGFLAFAGLLIYVFKFHKTKK